jgi:HSP20 family protein
MEDLTMSLIRFSNQYPSLFNSFFNNDMFDCSIKNYSKTSSTIPSVNIRESEAAFELEVAVPGFNKSDFKLDLDHDLLTVSSERSVVENNQGKGYMRREFSYQSFTRSFSLPEIADSEKISATYENGILLVSIPKKEETKQKLSRSITIQ